MALQLYGIQFKDSKTGEIFTLFLETSEVTVDSGRNPTSDEFAAASFCGGFLAEVFPACWKYFQTL